MKKESQKIEQLLEAFLASEPFAFPKKRENLRAPLKQGVYIILDPCGDTVHVGRTLRGKRGLYQRLRNHLNAASSFTKIYFNGDGSKLRSGYKYKYIVLADPRERALVEALAIGVLCPPHIGLGE
jgi:hypothetical protein